MLEMLIGFRIPLVIFHNNRNFFSPVFGVFLGVKRDFVIRFVGPMNAAAVLTNI